MKVDVKILLMAMVCLFIGAGGLFAAASALDLPLNKSSSAADGRKTAGRPSATAKPIEEDLTGPIVPLRERIVNLADPGILRYLKTTVVLEVYDPSPGPSTGPHGAPKKGDMMPEDLKPKGPLIEDFVTTLLTSKSTSELMTTQGKTSLKSELKAGLNKVLKDDRILAVYFTDFVIQ